MRFPLQFQSFVAFLFLLSKLQRERERDGIMEYERIDKVQMGIISPSKLRLKLMGPHHQRKKDGTNSNSSRTSPCRLEDAEFVENSLLAPQNGDFEEEGGLKDLPSASSHIAAPRVEASSVKLSSKGVSNSGQGDTLSKPKDILIPKETGDMGRVKIQQFSRSGSSNSTVHPVKPVEEDNPDYDSNASSSSFEFHKGERCLYNPMMRPFSRPVPSKWNDAEKWIMSRHPAHPNHSKKTILQNQKVGQPATNLVRVVPELTSSDHKVSVLPVSDTKQIDSCYATPRIGMEKFSFVSSGAHPISGAANVTNFSVDPCPFSQDKDVDHKELSGSERPTTDITVFPTIRAVSMRDMGTEMTPIPSQEPSRTATPVGATTPLRSPISSIPSTPRRGEPASTPVGATADDEAESQKGYNKDLSEEEMKLKTRREIVALGVQLGKMNIAAWASKDGMEKKTPPTEPVDPEHLIKIEYENRAAAWEEAEKSKHTARYKREEIKIQAWESQQKAKIEAEMRRLETQIEKMRAQAQEKIMKKIAIAKQRSEQKRAAAEAKRNRQASRTSAQAEYIRQTGHIPSSHFTCCNWL
ncbi:PREDICTED: uncharacterized protein LOC104610808 [Nelumbo nucifera]|uniref:Uncharacterized protein LOC104610808 n=1 Tax=Nelumbo nucifera TaxID=4432 RepID=A0A1U8B8F2_NELNU|nr:PREDICTED: uncharacterized protein LOC104610808 [Nelumbo nucifera]